MTTTNTNLILSLVLLISTSLASALLDRLTSSDQCTDQHISAAVDNIEECKPRPVIVKIPWPNNTNVHQMTPTHVQVNRCAGACHRTGRECLARAVRSREVAVLLGECGVTTGRCDKVCANVTVLEHTECHCGCHIDRLKCRAELHEVNTDVCSCQCRNEEERRDCLDRGELWTEETCQCGLQGTDQSTGWQTVLILVLSVSIVLMVLVIVILVKNIVSMRRKIRIQESIRNIQNIDCFYEFMTKKTESHSHSGATHSESKYDNVYAVSQSSSSEASSSVETQESSCESSRSGDTNTGPTHSQRHRVNTQPIDEALLLLKLSTDQL